MERHAVRRARIARERRILEPAAKVEIILRGLPEPEAEDAPEMDMDDMTPDGEEQEMNIAAVLARGQTAEFAVPEEACVLCPMVRNWSGVTLGPAYSVPAGTENVWLELTVRRDITGGITLRLKPAQHG